MAELKAWNPTARDRISSGLQGLLEMIGMDRYKAGLNARAVAGGGGGIGGSGIGLLDATPIGWALGAEEGADMAGGGIDQIRQGDVARGLLDVGLGGLALAGAPVGKVARATKTSGTALRSGRLADAKKEGAGALTVDQLKDSSAAVAARRKMIEDHMLAPVEPWTPPTNSLFDRSVIEQAMQGHPGVKQQPLKRIAPTARANLAPAQNLFSPENVSLIKLQAERGRKLGGDTYYPSTYAIRARYGETNGPLTFDDFVNANAATSPQAPLPINIPNATLMMYMKRQGIEPTWENARALAQSLKEKHGTGFFLGPSHVNNWNNAEAGLMTGFEDQQKIASYGEGLRGNFDPYTIDTHETKGLAMGTAYFPYFDKQKGVNSREYGTIERSAQNIADDIGMRPANMQAARWFGGGDLTGLKSPRGDFLNTFEDLIKWNAQTRGWDTSRSALNKKINGILQGDEILLPYWGKGGIKYDAGLFD